MALPEESHKYSDKKAFRSFDGEESVLGEWGVLLIYTSSGHSGVGESVDRIAELWVMVRWSWCACVYACRTDDRMNGLRARCNRRPLYRCRTLVY